MRNDDDRLFQYVIYRSRGGAYRYVVRQFQIRAGCMVSLGDWGGAVDDRELDNLRATLGKRGLTRLARLPHDEADIVEVWYS